MKNGLTITASLLGIAFALSGCRNDEQAEGFRPQESISYGVDPRTGFCFFYDKHNHVSGAGTDRIPCTDEVLDNVHPDDLRALKDADITPKL